MHKFLVGSANRTLIFWDKGAGRNLGQSKNNQNTDY